MTTPKLILVAGPYRSGTGDDPDLMAATRPPRTTTWPVFRCGHVPVRAWRWAGRGRRGHRGCGELPFADALAMTTDGWIADAKTITRLHWAAVHGPFRELHDSDHDTDTADMDR